MHAAITYHDLTEGISRIGSARVAAQFLNHPALTLGYRIEADGVAVYKDDDPVVIRLTARKPLR